jgi:hypothetical protein
VKANELRASLTDEQIVSLMKKLGVVDYKEDERSFQFPTICHNAEIDQASLKLYYYKDTKLFHCYTECGDTFNVFELLIRYYRARGIEKSFYDVFSMVANDFQDTNEGFEYFVYQKQQKKERRKLITLPSYPESVLNAFTKTYPAEWLYEHISPSTMDKYNILYSISQNKIIIPHYDLDGRLVGIRGRALNPEDIEEGKYKPVYVEGKLYNHPLSLNLYGFNYSREAIERTRTAILFESEKSVMLMDTYFPINNSVAVCGSNFNKNQLLLLLHNCKVDNIIIAFDKEYKKVATDESRKYFDKLRGIGEKYSKYCNFYYIADTEGLLDMKDSPIDKGPEIFSRLLSKKVLVRR